jgi:hypothetical protein
MTASKIDRRVFLATSAKAGVSLCGACACLGRLAVADEKVHIDPKNFNYCGYVCPSDCKFRRATIENDNELRQIAWAVWKIDERFGIPYKRKLAFCHGCKAPGEPEGVMVANCDVRACVRDKGFDCCIECDELEACDKQLWKLFPQFRQQVMALQNQYREQS